MVHSIPPGQHSHGSHSSHVMPSLVPRPFHECIHLDLRMRRGEGRRKEGFGEYLYPCADRNWNVREGVRMQL